ncbi:Flagellar protein YcgR [Marinomonas gallaica]|uniref:Flagellar protein YcgR n=1 Tax=Marinomonas gallaica TaxID=1806667 RepID=A0A1C3JUS0_9GAMM|nr:flagellar brake protein [Marinomonas gallaica]SBT18819.1 Flagellar protein YcgR [Marinomonas gallaica]SBT21774.1 Flagellar protein YcgR [Marinomonas gallaica]
MAEVTQVDFKDIVVPMGTNIQIEFISPPGRYSVRVLGRIPGRSLIVSCPKVNGKNIIVRDNQIVNVRLMSATSVCAFSTKIAKSFLEPAGHLHIAYPEYVETSEVRQAVRVEARLICSLEPNGEQPIYSQSTGVVVDLSTGGCKIVSKEDFGSVNQTMKLALNLQIGEFKHILKLDCEIRNQEIQMMEQLQASIADNAFLSRMGVEYMYVYGIKFNNIEKEQGIPLLAYILDATAKKQR